MAEDRSMAADRDTAEDRRPMTVGRQRRRPTPRAQRWPPLDEEMILRWADAHFARTGEWPTTKSGIIADSGGEKWSSISQGLRAGVRGLPGGSSLARLLAAHRGYRNRKGLRPYTEDQILTWCDAHFARNGVWPHNRSGPIEGTGGETWQMVAIALDHKIRGITRKSSIAQLLEAHRGRKYKRPPLTIDVILRWSDAYHDRNGEWPTMFAPPIEEMKDETWTSVDRALRHGLRDLPVAGSSLARLLEKERGQPNRANMPRMTTDQILMWADAYHTRTGQWPKSESGALEERPDLTWAQLNWSLNQGNRGLDGGSSLARLLAESRGVRNHAALPRLSEMMILSWADAYFDRWNRWPNVNSGSVEEAPAETWENINCALEQGSRGLGGRSSLARLLAEKRGRRNLARLPDLSEEQILAWADAHFQRTGSWPTEDSGSICEAPGETWNGVTTYLRLGRRGLPGGSSLPRLLADRRGRKLNMHAAPLSRSEILLWADAFHARMGRWPTSDSGEVFGVAGQTWNAINAALEHGIRSLDSGDSIARLLARERGKRNRSALPPLSEETILQWARCHKERTGKWPTQKSGPVEEAPDETWGAIDSSLVDGRRGLPGGASLPILLNRIRGQKSL